MFEFKLPDLGEGVHEGEVLKWHVAEGDTLVEDEPLVDVETDKAAVTIPSPKGGTIVCLNGNVGDIILVGDVIAVIDAGDGAVKTAPAKSESASPKPEAEKTTIKRPAPSGARHPGRIVPATPATRRLARELGIDLRNVTPSGPGGRVTPEDLHAHAEGKPASPGKEKVAEERRATAEFAAGAASAIPFFDVEPMPEFEKWGAVTREPLRSIRRKVAHRMTTSMILVPHVAHMDDADVTELLAFREREKARLTESGEQAPTLLAFVVKAVTAGLIKAPSFNASLDPFREEIVYKQYYNVGIAVDTGRGLVVPVVRDTDKKSVLEIAADIRDLAGRAREGKINVDDLRGGTFSITNVGPLGGTALIPTINYPEVAILGMGRVQEKPVVKNGEIVIRKVLPMTLAFDHRVADGADAARFVSELSRVISEPLAWLAGGI